MTDGAMGAESTVCDYYSLSLLCSQEANANSLRSESEQFTSINLLVRGN